MTSEGGERGDATTATSGPERASAFAPATISNVGPGFDCFGFALEDLGDVVHLAPRAGIGVVVESITGAGGDLPTDPARNTAAVAAAAVWSRCGLAGGLGLRLEKSLPGGTGLGSSAASAVAGAEAAMRLAGRSAGVAYDADLVLDAALDGEAVVSGARHADNVGPSFLGGFTIVRGVDPPRIARFEPALDLRVVAVYPSMTISTQAARAALPTDVPLGDAVRGWSNAATLVLGLVRGDVELVRDALVDGLVEPHRAKLVPGYDAAKRGAIEAGAVACALSGSGPTMFALALTDVDARAAGTAMRAAFEAEGLTSIVHAGRIAPRGAREITPS